MTFGLLWIGRWVMALCSGFLCVRAECVRCSAALGLVLGCGLLGFLFCGLL